MNDLFDKIEQGDLESLTEAIRKNPESLRIVNKESMTPLLFAVYTGKTAAAELISSTAFDFTLHERVAMNDQDKVAQTVERDPTLLASTSADGWTPLHLAAFFGHEEMVRLLLDFGAPVDAPSTSPASFGNSSLQAAVTMSRFEIVRLLLDRGADVNFVQRPSLLTPLHIAAARKEMRIVRLLVEKGADKNAVSADGRRPVDIADERNNPDVASYLRNS